MEIRRRTTANYVLNGLLAGAMSALVCFAQKPPASHSAARSTAQSSSASSASATNSSPHKVVLKVGNTQVTKSEVDYLISNLNPRAQRALEARGRKPVGDEYAMMVLLSQKAKSDHLDTTTGFQQKIALEKLQLLAQAEYQKIAQDITISPQDVTAYYTAHKGEFEQAELREFVVRKKPADAKAGTPGLPVAEAKARLASIQKAVEAGTDLQQIATKFDVPNTVIVNPKPVTVRKGEMLPALDKVAFELKDNQFSQPVETPNALILLQMVKHQHPTVQAVSDEIENVLRQQKLKTTLDSMRANANIWMDPEYFKTPENSSAPSAATPKTPAHP